MHLPILEQVKSECFTASFGIEEPLQTCGPESPVKTKLHDPFEPFSASYDVLLVNAVSEVLSKKNRRYPLNIQRSLFGFLESTCDSRLSKLCRSRNHCISQNLYLNPVILKFHLWDHFTLHPTTRPRPAAEILRSGRSPQPHRLSHNC